MNNFLDATQDFFSQIIEDVMTVVNLLLSGTGIVYGTLRAVIFIIILALIMGYTLNNRRATPSGKVVIAILVVVVVFVLYTVFGN